MSHLSTASYKGARDFYPEDKRIQNYIFGVWHKVARRYGYQEYMTPLLEPLEVYAAKSGQDLVNDETYSFTDRGERVVCIRPEMTPSVSRLVAARRQEMGYPARLYSIANFMRYERPQRGREREFWQLNADIFGVEGIVADAEIISMAHEIMQEFGASDKMYSIRINNRKLIDYAMTTYLGLDGVGAQMMIRLLDKKSKMDETTFAAAAADIFGDEAKAGMVKLEKLTHVKAITELPAELQDSEIVKELNELFGHLLENGVTNAVFDMTLMRGFDYYTGTVFELFDHDPENNRSMFGGGRYDGLVGLFGVEPIATVGFAPGLSTTELFLRSHNLLPELVSTTEIAIVVLGDNLKHSLKLARKFRAEKVNVEVDISGRKIDKQIKAVLKKDIPYMLFVGDDEVASETYTLKNTKTAEEEKLGIERIVSQVKDRRGKVDNDLDLYFD